MLLRYFRRKTEPAHLGVLRNVPLFSDLKTHELATLDDLLHQRTYVKDEIIFDQNEEGQAIYFILTGKVGISRQGPVRYSRQPKVIAELAEGQFFGERALLEDAPRIAQAHALEDCRIAVLFREDFLRLVHTHPEIAEKISLHCSLRNSNNPIETDDEEAFTFTSYQNIPGPVTWAGIIATTCLSLFLFKKLLWLVVPFLLALILYYALVPISKRLVLSGMTRTMSAIVLSTAFLVLIGVLVVLFYPWAIANAPAWQASFVNYLAGGALLMKTVLKSLQMQFGFLQNAQFGNELYQNFVDFSQHFSDRYLAAFLYGLATWLPSLLLVPLITFFLLKDGATLRKLLGGGVPNAFFEKTLYLMHAVNRTARLYFIGLIKITLLDTLIVGCVLWWLGLNTPFLLALVVAVLSWIPYIGPLLGAAMVLIVAATDFPGNMPLIYSLIGLFMAMRIIDDFVFLPLIVGKSLHIHPLLTLMMFMVGEAIAGVPGLMVVIPILAVVMVLGETLEIILMDTRLQARHRYATRLRWFAANQDLKSSE